MDFLSAFICVHQRLKFLTLCSLCLCGKYFYFLVLFIIDTLAAGFAGALTFVTGRPICLRIVSGSGMPGVWVLPGLKPFFNASALGIPGIGLLPSGKTFAFKEIPGGRVAEGSSGLAERPGGIFAGSSFISRLVMALEFRFALALAFAFDGALEPQPIPVMTITKPSKINEFLYILVES